MSSRHKSSDCIALVELCGYISGVQNPYVEVDKNANLHCIEEVGHLEVAHNTGNMLKHAELSVTMAQGEFSIIGLAVGITMHPVEIVTSPGVLFVRNDIIFNIILMTVVTHSDMPLGMM
jgi:hypothetical protein